VLRGLVAKTPEPLRRELRRRLEAHVEKHWKDRCRRIEIRFHGLYTYVDAYPIDTWFQEGTTEADKERIRNTPLHLCRIDYIGHPEKWGFAFYKYSDNVYEVSILPSGAWEDSPEACFDCAANVYLSGPW